MGKLTRRKRRHNKNNNNTNNDHSTDEQLKQGEKYNNDNNNNSNPKNLISRGTIFQFIISWFVIGIVVNHMSTSSSSSSSNAINNNSLSNSINNTTNSSHIDIDATTSTSASTGNNNNNAVTTKFEISKEEIESYHEIVKMPKVWKYVQQQEHQDANNKRLKLKQFKVYNVIDFTSNVNGTIIKQFGPTSNESTRTALTLAPHQKFVLSIINIPNTNHNNKNKVLSMGRYNEIRKGMYTTSLFQNDTYTIDSYKGERIVHIGIDIYASANTKIYSFSNGIIHSFGYNPQKGDYGYVIVIEYDIITTTGSYNKLWALYGHLSKRSIKRKHIGNKVKKGQVIGYIGDIHENGGWPNPHVHFQLSIHEPETHDMPGVVSMHDRDRALIHYPDPRIVLGPLY